MSDSDGWNEHYDALFNERVKEYYNDTYFDSDEQSEVDLQANSNWGNANPNHSPVKSPSDDYDSGDETTEEETENHGQSTLGWTTLPCYRRDTDDDSDGEIPIPVSYGHHSSDDEPLTKSSPPKFSYAFGTVFATSQATTGPRCGCGIRVCLSSGPGDKEGCIETVRNETSIYLPPTCFSCVNLEIARAAERHDYYIYQMSSYL